MPDFTPNFFSIVFIGKQNPQILNHNFLIENKVLPVRREPFKSLMKNSSKKKSPFTEYLSTPVVATISYKWISIIIEENRFQIKDANFKVPSKSPIISITKEYFGRRLRYTPFLVGGINFAGRLNFSSEADEKHFDDCLGIDSTKVETYLELNSVRYSTKISSFWNGDKIELQVNKPKEGLKDGNLNFNFEFLYQDINSFIDKLNEVDKIHNKFKNILKKIKVEVR